MPRHLSLISFCENSVLGTLLSALVLVPSARRFFGMTHIAVVFLSLVAGKTQATARNDTAIRVSYSRVAFYTNDLGIFYMILVIDLDIARYGGHPV